MNLWFGFQNVKGNGRRQGLLSRFTQVLVENKANVLARGQGLVKELLFCSWLTSGPFPQREDQQGHRQARQGHENALICCLHHVLVLAGAV